MMLLISVLPELAYTPMMNSEKFAIDESYRNKEFQTTSSDRPLVAHFSANNPQTLLTAAKFIEDQCDAIDLNLGILLPTNRKCLYQLIFLLLYLLGCPQRIAHSGHFGSYLLGDEDRELVLDIVKTVSSAIKIPMFVKIRLLDTIDDTIKLCKQLKEAGASLIAIHGRWASHL